MSSTLKSLRAVSDPTRLRIVALLEKEELSVNELQEITRLGQSRISTHLGLLSDCDLVRSRLARGAAPSGAFAASLTTTACPMFCRVRRNRRSCSVSFELVLKVFRMKRRKR